MKKILIITVIIALSGMAFSQKPEKDAVFKEIVQEYTLNKDGSIDFHYYKKLEILSHFAFHRLYGETFIVFNPKFQELEINKAVTTMADGTVVDSPENAFNEVLPGFADDAPAYNHLREMVVTHTGLEVGAVIELDYNLKSSPEFYPALLENIELIQSSPVEKMTVKVSIPKGKTLNHQVFNLRTAPETSEKKDSQVFTWTFVNLSAESHESHQPEFGSHLPRLCFSTADWETIYDLVNRQPAFDFSVNGSMKQAVGEAVKDKNPIQQMLAIQKMVVSDVNYYPVPLEYTGYTARKPVEVWKSNGGTELEKNLLLTALLKNAGKDANLVMTVPEQFYNAEQGNLALATSFLVRVLGEDKSVHYLSAIKVKGNGMPNENLILIPLIPEGEFSTSNPNPVRTKIEVSGVMEIDDSLHVSGDLLISLNGKANPYYSLAKDQDNWKKIVTGLQSENVDTILDSEVFYDQSSVKIEFDNKDHFKKYSNYYFGNLPLVNSGLESFRLNVLTSERDDPLELPETLSESYTYEVNIQGDTEIVAPGISIEISEPFGSMSIIYDEIGDGIRIVRSISIDKRIIEVSQYESFKNMINTWYDSKYRKLIIKSGEE